MNNKKEGNVFEENFAIVLWDRGFWTHRLAQNQTGQPADIIAVKNNKAYLIDCKVCSNDIFDLNRIEYNQELSMRFWTECGNGEGWFALYIQQTVIMICFSTLKSYSKIKMSYEDIMKIGTPLEDWLDEIDNR